MKKACRLLKSADFKAVLDQRHCLGKNESVSVFYAPNTLKHARIGISVSTKVGNAVVRGRVRRQLRAQINLCEVLSHAIDVVIIAHSGYLNRSFDENTKILNNMFTRFSNLNKGEKA